MTVNCQATGDTAFLVTFKSTPWQLSDKARAKIEEARRRQTRAVQTAHLFWFD